ncbi:MULTISPECIES: SyrB-like regulator [Rhizobium]|uniref:SyrB-like regulator n=1 Tax=Rhizobium TaxID=379 RepID=UPI000FF35765|nr:MULTISPECIES: SyrB-like regulator [Rhizobium]MBY5828591.1 SyrB-like regulator [Rhizobium leguminosarum]MBY5856328.1 SyrB-like regulator [Rhizobium leguminosarum]NEI96532.1 SyrB-like regulator [Rhizobium ruizarguesonis]NEJ33845.1 SyrB-like regulator [Rhizobium ruizarguesonis]RWY76349.1 SyrB-like regulator [Rhizobium leguminosarum]
MADEDNAGAVLEGAETNTPVKAPAVKKQRARRVKKPALEATAAPSIATTEKVKRGRRKRSEQTDDVTVATAAPAAAGKRGAKAVPQVQKGGTRVKRARPSVETPTSAIDEMAELLMLEEENKKLRKSLADKLRGENADLRKRLGLD